MFCMAILVTFIAFPGTGLHGMFVIPIGRVYTIVSANIKSGSAVY